MESGGPGVRAALTLTCSLSLDKFLSLYTLRLFHQCNENFNICLTGFVIMTNQ